MAGGKSQRREQNGGYHRWAQNDRRLHFGLGTNNSARISVRWPSGTDEKNYTNAPANRLYEVIEGNPVLVPIDAPTSTPPSECEPTVGMPDYESDGRPRAVHLAPNLFIATLERPRHRWRRSDPGLLGRRRIDSSHLTAIRAASGWKPTTSSTPWQQATQASAMR